MMIHKISVAMLCVVAMNTALAGSKATQTTEAANYAAQKNALVANINTCQKNLEREEFKLSELLRKVESAKQFIRDAQLAHNQAKAKLNELESWYRSLPQY